MTIGNKGHCFTNGTYNNFLILNKFMFKFCPFTFWVKTFHIYCANSTQNTVIIVMNIVISIINFHLFLGNIFIYCIRGSFNGFQISFVIIFPNAKVCQWTTFIFYNTIYSIIEYVNFITPVLSKSFVCTILRNFPSFHFVISAVTFERKACTCITWFNVNSFIIVVNICILWL